MPMTKSKVELSRVNMNLPTSLVDRVKAYSLSRGVNLTSSYAMLLNIALTTTYLLDELPELLNLYSLMTSNLSEEEKKELELVSPKDFLKGGSA